MLGFLLMLIIYFDHLSSLLEIISLLKQYFCLPTLHSINSA